MPRTKPELVEITTQHMKRNYVNQEKHQLLLHTGHRIVIHKSAKLRGLRKASVFYTLRKSNNIISDA